MASVTIPHLERFEAVCADPYAGARAHAEQGGKVAGFMCSYAPQELFHAAGYLPVRIIGREGGTERSDRLLQPFACSFARSAFDCALGGDFDFLSLAVFSHTCDTMQNLADLWKAHTPDAPVLIVSVPTQVAGAAALEYFRSELHRVKSELEAIAGPIPEGRLRDSVRLYLAHQQRMRDLYALRRAHPGLMTGSQMMAVVMSSFLMPKEEHHQLLSEVLDALRPVEDGSRIERPRVLVGGSVCQSRAFIDAIESAGCTVADDDLCMGSRSFLLPDIDESDPIDAILQSYAQRTPCPAFHKPGFHPGGHIVERARAAQADGVVYLLTKFCDPAGFDYPPERKALEDAGIPVLMLEVEQHLPVPQQLTTRVEAFAEMLETRAGA